MSEVYPNDEGETGLSANDLTLQSYRSFLDSPDLDPEVKAFFESTPPAQLSAELPEWSLESFPFLKAIISETSQKTLELIYDFLVKSLGESPQTMSVAECERLFEIFKTSALTQDFRKTHPQILDQVQHLLINAKVDTAIRDFLEEQRLRHRKFNELVARLAKVKENHRPGTDPLLDNAARDITKLDEYAADITSKFAFIESSMPERKGGLMGRSFEAGTQKRKSVERLDFLLTEFERILTHLER